MQQLELLTLDEAAKLLKVSRSFLYKKVAVKGVPHVRCGRLIRFSGPDLERWMGGQGA